MELCGQRSQLCVALRMHKPQVRERLACALALVVRGDAHGSRRLARAQHLQLLKEIGVLLRRPECQEVPHLVVVLTRVLLHVVLNSEAVVQQEPGVALATVRVEDLAVRGQSGQRMHDERVLRRIVAPGRLPGPAVVQHVCQRHKRVRFLPVHHNAEVATRHSRTRPHEIVQGRGTPERWDRLADHVVV